MTESPSRFASWTSWTLRRRVGSWFIALAILLVLAFAAVALALLQFKSNGDEIINRWEPAYAASEAMLTDMVNQETGLRGFVIGKEETFLRPYNRSSAALKAHEARLRQLVDGHTELLDRLASFDRQADSWRTGTAQKYIAEVRAGNPSATALTNDLAAKRAFDQVRAAAAELTDHIGRVRDATVDRRRSLMLFCFVATAIAASLTIGSNYVLWRGLQRQVLDPVDALAEQTREVAGGAIDRRIAPSGPPELAGLGADVDTMRARIADQLARVEQARLELEQRSEELARSNADLEQFAYVASHDLSEPLRKVANFCQLLERQYADQLDDKAKQYIGFAVDGAKRMQVLIADLLAFSRVGRTTENFEPVDTDRVLTRALATLDERVTAADAEVVRHPLPTVEGDATLLTALFQNLVGNALKYRSPERTLQIEISAERDGDDWLFTVTDNGIGIDAQYAERIFAIFQRLHLRDAYGGTGIGLALCRRIVEFHRGRIWLAEGSGPGATFQFVIPDRVESVDDLSDLAETAYAHEH